MTTKLFKHDRNGWTAETHFDNVTGGMGLEVRTVKRSGGVLATTCHAYSLENGFRVFNLLGGYRETVIQETARATEKSVEDQHERALTIIESSGFHNMIKFYCKPLAA